ncbi:GlpM family protein [Dyella lipolytica]|uniref:GlpM family protein n=2 Tax=Dyella lipolytica TaxID=1867835 RepID=A0ABW8ISW9_9GAMM
MNLALKALIGALMVLLIGVLSRTRNYYIAGLLPLFPTFALMAHYIVGSERGVADLKATIVFGVWAMAPYLAYLISLYWLVDRLPLVPALLVALIVWCGVAAAAVLLWQRH